MRVLYISHNGVGTALVRSQVLPYLRGLGERGVDVWLLTYERNAPAFPEGEFPRHRWHAVRARPGTHLPAKALDILVGVAAVVWAVVQGKAEVLHARSYLPAGVAWMAARLTGRPFLFDMRGFLGDEYVEGGHWRKNDSRYRALRLAEARLLADASEIVVLTEAAARRLRSEPRYARHVGGKPITVVPCAVDLAGFRPAARRAATPTLVYSGSLGMWYLLDEMLVVYARARALAPALRFLILNLHEHRLIRDAIDRLGLSECNIEIRAARFEDMPAAVASAHVGIALLRQTASKLGSSPIKVAEYLACGLPVVLNAGVGDLDALVRDYRAGHVLPGFTEEHLAGAARAVVELLDDAAARASARRLAEDVYDVRSGVEKYDAAYRRLAARRTARPSSGIL